ncbi:MAG: hypothetical protein ACXU93_07990, partial [Thermodesulfobacteriota bacterium]
KAIAEGERAMALNPGATGVITAYADCLTFSGRPEEAIPLCQKAIRLTPFGGANLYRELGMALRIAGRLEEGGSAYKKAIQLSPDNFLAHIHLTTAYSIMGREKEARSEAAEILRINPRFSLDYWGKALGAAFKDQSKKDEAINALRRAGLK